MLLLLNPARREDFQQVRSDASTRPASLQHVLLNTGTNTECYICFRQLFYLVQHFLNALEDVVCSETYRFDNIMLWTSLSGRQFAPSHPRQVQLDTVDTVDTVLWTACSGMQSTASIAE